MDKIPVDGIRVRDVGSGVTLRDLKVYFSNPKNGGGRVSQIYFPLLDHGAAVIFEDPKVVAGITNRKHRVGNCDVTVERLPRKMFSKVTVELEPHVTQLLDQDSTYLDVLQFEGELDVNFDAETMNYIMTGNWYQVEWAWYYLENIMTRKSNPASYHNIPDQLDQPNILSPNIPITADDPVAAAPETAQTYHHSSAPGQDTGREQNNIKWNVNRNDTNSSAPYQQLKSNMQQYTERTGKVYMVNKFPGGYGSESRTGSSNRMTLISGGNTSDVHMPLLDNPIRGRDMWNTGNQEQDSDDTDDELASAYLYDRAISPEPILNVPRRRMPSLMVPRPRVPSPKGIELLHSDFGDMPLTFEAIIGSLQVKVAMGDIVKERSDAIVNPTNQNMTHMYGISAAIARMAGRDLIEECRRYISRNGFLEVGQVVKTCAGGALDHHVDFVLHVVPPTWRENESESTAHILTCTYMNCLQYANKQLWIRSLSLPILGAGGLGIPLDVSVQAFFDAVHLHVAEEKQTPHLQVVHLVSNMQDSACAVIVVLRSLLDLDQDESQKGAIDRYVARSHEFQFKANDFWLDKEKSNTTDEQKGEVPSKRNDGDCSTADMQKGARVEMASRYVHDEVPIQSDEQKGVYNQSVRSQMIQSECLGQKSDIHINKDRVSVEWRKEQELLAETTCDSPSEQLHENEEEDITKDTAKLGVKESVQIQETVLESERGKKVTTRNESIDVDEIEENMEPQHFNCDLDREADNYDLDRKADNYDLDRKADNYDLERKADNYDLDRKADNRKRDMHSLPEEDVWNPPDVGDVLEERRSGADVQCSDSLDTSQRDDTTTSESPKDKTHHETHPPDNA